MSELLAMAARLLQLPGQTNAFWTLQSVSNALDNNLALCATLLDLINTQNCQDRILHVS